MGQVHLVSVQSNSLPNVWAAVCRAGFTLARLEPAWAGDEEYRCRRDDRQLVVAIYHDPRDSPELFLVIAHPPYSPWPWRWIGDIRFFNDLADILDDFRYRD